MMALIFFNTGCSSKVEKLAEKNFGHQFNTVRQKYGIPVLPTSASYRGSTDSSNMTWAIWGETFPLHDLKTVMLDDKSEIVSETDRYVTDEKVSIKDPDYQGVLLDEVINIRYFFSNQIPYKVECYSRRDGEIDYSDAVARLKKSGISLDPVKLAQ